MTEEQKIEEDEQKVINKISSFNYRELLSWIKTRLQGHDIPLHWRRSSPGKFLYHLFQFIKIEKSREDFVKVINELTEQLKKISRGQVVKNKDYISGLLFIYGKIKQINDKNTLLQIAISGKFKGIRTRESELHVVHENLKIADVIEEIRFLKD